MKWMIQSSLNQQNFIGVLKEGGLFVLWLRIENPVIEELEGSIFHQVISILDSGIVMS